MSENVSYKCGLGDMYTGRVCEVKEIALQINAAKNSKSLINLNTWMMVDFSFTTYVNKI